ncbi:alpha/beta hydrolase family protein [Aurantiacibacter sp. MUD61]|uniref:alpha/beta hydrolase family protein n=1 Tax=Aurantiacibacter sp. MUD61 TaxID=3009083 RepID=UPI0022F00D01|nr:prolyl oligopeptidase family serine peptidase [Aurantiacibacter sp. MUD61]
MKFSVPLAAMFGALILAMPVSGFAQEPASQAQVGASDIPPEIPTSAFSSQSQMRGAQLSPDGSKFAFTMMANDALYLSIYDASNGELVDGTHIGDQDLFNFFRWAGNNRILLSVNRREERRDYTSSRLIAYELGTNAMAPLVLPRMSFDGDDIIHIDPEGDFVLVSMARGTRSWPAVYRFDLTNLSAGAPEPRTVQEDRDNVFSWIADETGTVRMGIAVYRRGRYRLLYRSNGQNSFSTVARTRADDEDAFEYWNFGGLRSGRDTGYTFGIPEGADRRALMEFDFSTGEVGDVVFASEDEDVTSVVLDEAGNPIGVGYAGDNYRREWIDPELRRWREQLGNALTGSRVTILDTARDRSRMLVLQSGPDYPGALYAFTPETRHLGLFAEYRPEVPQEALVRPRLIRYEARDGTEIPAYLTLPRGRGETGLPLIVHPHGGPFGVRDTDRYNDMVQLMANRGYAVIQPNFRGSGGYGEAYELLGNGQIGRAMQDDLDDAVAHLVAEGIVDPDRVCIWGESYGGFAAVWGAIRNPEIYRCAISFAGVMHFERQLQYDRDFLFGRNKGRWWDRVDGDQTDFDLDDVSPAVQVARLTRPVLLVHGEEDEIVPYDQYELMLSRANRAEVDIETLSFEESGHSFDGPEDEQAYFDAALDFLERHNPAD